MPVPRRAVVRIAILGAATSLLVAAAGWIVQRALLGATAADAQARVERDVRVLFDGMERRLTAMAGAVAEVPRVRAAAAADGVAVRELFAAARAAVASGEPADVSLTIYDPEGQALAWAGRTTELPPEALAAADSWRLSPGPLGVRLDYVRAVMDDGARVATIVASQVVVAAERPLAGRTTPAGAALPAITLPTRFAPVSIRLPRDAATPPDDAHVFTLAAPSGEPLLSASVSAADVRATRARWQRTTWSLVMFTLAGAGVLFVGPLLDWRNRATRPSTYAEATVMAAAVIVLARAVVSVASPADWSDAPLFSSSAYASPLLRPLLVSPFDFLVTAAAAGALVGLLLFGIESWRLHQWRRRRTVAGARTQAAYLILQVAAGLAMAAVVIGHRALLRNTIANTTLDLLDFALDEWNPPRLALQIGLVFSHAAAVGLGVAILRSAQIGWRVRRADWPVRLAAVAAWIVPLVMWRLAEDPAFPRHLPLLAAAAAIVLLTHWATRLLARFRHGSQAFRLTLLTLALAAPAFAFYPALFQLAWNAKSQLVESVYAPNALNQRQNALAQVQQSLDEIDARPNLVDLVTQPLEAGETTDRAFDVWQSSSLGDPPITSSVELFGPDRRLVSRFAFNLPEDPATVPGSEESSCGWTRYAENLPFFAEERVILHAGRLICGDDPSKPIGSIVIHAMLTDYENLGFIASTSPYVELLRTPERTRGEGLSGRDVEYAVYGWSRSPLYASGGPAWPLPDDVFARIETARDPFWAELRRGADAFDVYLLNDRYGIYALGFPVVSALDHLVHLAELTVLAALAYLILLTGNAIFGVSSRRAATAPALLREIRASFYRKLFIAFVAAVFLPVVSLAIVTRVYVADRIRTNIEEEAVRMASTASSIVEDFVAPRATEGLGVDDNLLVWVSRLIDQDVNIFSRGRLVATSERNLFASGLLPTRTPADIHLALLLRNEAATVTRERVGSLNEYLVAGTPLFEQDILTVPLTARQQQIEAEIETLDRRVLLAALLFMLAGAGLGYSMAERISDPVNRLTRATRRIARGDLDARIAATSSDELRRLVEAFNSMARDLQRQRGELERTNRLEAWAEMARQVAHEIKNPLTPIQLNAEHLRRVHADRGQPLGPILQDCVETILTQVKLLRQIASEFSSFASSPTARPQSVEVTELLHEVIAPYRVGLADRIQFDIDIPDGLPRVHVDRSLVARSLSNIVENALHAMPGTGTLSVAARGEPGHVRVRVADTGAGMDAEALARAFEPYFSTKTTGTGLGLPIAKRNVELMGGTIAVTSERDKGTIVEITLPLASQ